MLALPVFVTAQVEADFSMPDTIGCAPLSVTFTNTSKGVDSVRWDFGVGSNSAFNPSWTFTEDGTYQISLIACNTATGVCDTAIQTLTVLSPLLVRFDADTLQGCSPLYVSFINNSHVDLEDSVLSYTWDFGDGHTSQDSTPTHNYTTTGQFDVSLEIETKHGCSEKIIKPAFIQAGSLPDPNLIQIWGDDFANNSQKYCLGDTLQFSTNALSLYPSASLEWNFTPSISHSVIELSNHDSTFSMISLDTGETHIEINVENFGCANTLTVPHLIKIIKPVAQFIADSIICGAPATVQFSAQSPSASEWNWDFGDGNTTILQNPTHTFASKGTYTPQLIISTVEGCSDTISKQIIVAEPPQAAFDFAAGTHAGCTPLSTTFENLSIGATTYTWQFGDGASSNQPTPTHTYTSEGLFTPTLIAVDSLGCADTISIRKGVTTDNVTGNISIDKLSGCTPLVINLTANLTPNLASNTPTATQPVINVISDWEWDFGDGNISTQSSPNHTYTQAGNFPVSLRVETNYGCEKTFTLYQDIQAKTPAPLDWTYADPDQTYCVGENICLNYTGVVDSSMSLTWELSDPINNGGVIFLGTGPYPCIQIPDMGNYDIMLTINNGGCITSHTEYNAISVVDPVAAFPISDTILCGIPISTQFNASGLGMNTWTWDFGDGNSGTGQNLTHTYTTPGTYIVTLDVEHSEAANCLDSYSRTLTVSAPIADFTNSATVGCAPTIIDFNNQSQRAQSYTWNFGDGNTSTQTTPMHTYATPGAFDISLIATDSLGCSDTLAHTNYITSSDITADFSTDQTVGCGPFSVNFQDLSSINPVSQMDSIVSWLWIFGDGDSSTLQNPTHTYTEGGSFEVSLLVTSGNGCTNIRTQSDYITVHRPSPLFNTNDSITCPQTDVQFINQSTGDLGTEPIGTYQWEFGDGNTSLDKNPIHQYTNTGSYTTKLIVTDQHGCQDSLEQTGFINITLPVSNFGSYLPHRSCTPFTLNLTDSSSSDVIAWNWNFGDGNTATGPNPSHTYTQPGLYTVSLTVTDAYGCQDSISRIDYAAFILPTANFTHSQTRLACDSVAIQFNDASTSAIVAWDWNFGDGTTDSTQNPIHTYQAAGSYIVELTVTDTSGCTDILQIPTQIEDLQVLADFQLSDSAGCTPFVTQFTDASSSLDSIVQWSWTFGDGNVSSSANPQHTYTAPGAHDVCLAVETLYGCKDTLCQDSLIRIANPFANVSIDGCSIVAGDTSSTYTYTLTGLNPDENMGWSLIPSHLGTIVAGSTHDSIQITFAAIDTTAILQVIGMNECETDTFQFVIQIDTSYVYPGDVNLDGRLSLADMLRLQDEANYLSSTTGNPRTLCPNDSASYAWFAQPASNWTDSLSFNSGINTKHLDINGNGDINTQNSLLIPVGTPYPYTLDPTNNDIDAMVYNYYQGDQSPQGELTAPPRMTYPSNTPQDFLHYDILFTRVEDSIIHMEMATRLGSITDSVTIKGISYRMEIQNGTFAMVVPSYTSSHLGAPSTIQTLNFGLNDTTFASVVNRTYTTQGTGGVTFSGDTVCRYNLCIIFVDESLRPEQGKSELPQINFHEITLITADNELIPLMDVSMDLCPDMDAFESNNTIDNATVLPPSGVNGNANICPADDQDWYEVTIIPGKRNAHISLSQLGYDAILELWDAQGNLIDQSNNPHTSAENITQNFLPPGSYYIRVRGHEGHFGQKPYNLHITTQDFPFAANQWVNPTDIKNNEQTITNDGIQTQPQSGDPIEDIEKHVNIPNKETPSYSPKVVPPTLSIYPNPTHDTLNINLYHTLPMGGITLVLKDVHGRIIQQFTYQVTHQVFEHTLRLHTLSAGVYFLEIQGESFSPICKRIVKQ